jgi:hypothetical protein
MIMEQLFKDVCEQGSQVSNSIFQEGVAYFSYWIMKVSSSLITAMLSH